VVGERVWGLDWGGVGWDGVVVVVVVVVWSGGKGRDLIVVGGRESRVGGLMGGAGWVLRGDEGMRVVLVWLMVLVVLDSDGGQ